MHKYLTVKSIIRYKQTPIILWVFDSMLSTRGYFREQSRLLSLSRKLDIVNIGLS